MKSDRELLELAAKAAGIELLERPEVHSFGTGLMSTNGVWSPLTDDGDALRLAVKLGIKVFSPDLVEYHNGGDLYAATRRAIVRAAAEIGRSME